MGTRSRVTVRIDEALAYQLRRVSRELGRPCAAIVRDALRRQVALRRFEEVRRRMTAGAPRRWRTDRDVFREVS